jgi:hypothetical protein
MGRSPISLAQIDFIIGERMSLYSDNLRGGSASYPATSFARTANTSSHDCLLKPSQVMALMGYSNQDAFMRMARRQGMPRIRHNKRVMLFERQAVHLWLRKRSVG